MGTKLNSVCDNALFKTGKTTLFNMLTGMTSPTKGSAYLYGYDLRYCTIKL